MLSPTESRTITNLLEPSPTALARRMRCTAAQAKALQHYLVLVFVAAHRRAHGGDAAGASARAHACLKRVPPRVRVEIEAALGTVDLVPQKSGIGLREAAAP